FLALETAISDQYAYYQQLDQLHNIRRSFLCLTSLPFLLHLFLDILCHAILSLLIIVPMLSPLSCFRVIKNAPSYKRRDDYSPCYHPTWEKNFPTPHL